MASKKLLDSVALKIADYRKGEIAAPDADHVERWISQFDPEVRDPILTEVLHVLGQTYITRHDVNNFLKGLSTNAKLTNGKPEKFWKETSLLKIQRNGSSQKEMLQLFGAILEKAHQFDIDAGPQDSHVAVYIDDVVFGGGHVRGDLVPWIKNTAPKKVTVHIIVLAYHLGGQWYADQQIAKAAQEAGKVVKVAWWSLHAIEDRRYYIYESDVLRPTRIPDHKPSHDYAKVLTEAGYPPVLRKPGSVGKAKFYSGEKGRDLLEQQFLMKGTEIRTLCPNLIEFQRPLGNTLLSTLGFGAMIVTYRNCPNNCPLALWVGDPWYPLCPRRTN
jgi:hypothetical protein